MPFAPRDQFPRDFSRPAAGIRDHRHFAMARQLIEADATTVATGQPHVIHINSSLCAQILYGADARDNANLFDTKMRHQACTDAIKQRIAGGQHHDPFIPAGGNPTETIINNSISMLAAGNSIYFSPHPGAKKVSLKLISLIEEIAFRCCGIRNLVVTVAEPTFEATQQMMAHPRIAVLAITGGPGIVAMGMKSGKKVIGAGAGNPPCIVDETADLVKAAEDIINGASFDYNLPCIAEKSLIVVESVAERLVQQMQTFGALLLSPADTDKLRAVCLPEGQANKKLVGKSPSAMLEAAGIAVPAKAPRLLIALVNADDPWVTSEQLMPMLPVVKVSDFDSALALALKVEEGLHHTAIMHSQNVSRLNLAARTLQTSIFVKNGPSYAGIGVGGEGFTTFTIATPTGEGTTSARTFARSRRCVLTNGFSIR